MDLPWFESYPLTPHIYRTLFDPVFDSDAFLNWSEGDCKRPLLVYGAPGAGKTTLAALTLERLRTRTSQSGISAASIFIRQEIPDDCDTWMKPLLNRVIQQLSSQDVLQPNSSSQKDVILDRTIESLREELLSKLSGSLPSYLIIDDIHRVRRGSLPNTCILDELIFLAEHGLRTMVTSRIPRWREINYTCDVKVCGRKNIDIYWVCLCCHRPDNEPCHVPCHEHDNEPCYQPDNKPCYEPTNKPYCEPAIELEAEYMLCYNCMKKNPRCSKCKGTKFVDTERGFIYYELPEITEDQMRMFLERELEREHGDLGLMSLVESKPPASKLGLLLSEQGTDYIERFIKALLQRAGRNIQLAKLRLETIHASETLRDVEVVHDRLPRDIVSLFDTIIEWVTRLPEEQKRCALEGIRASTEEPLGTRRWNKYKVLQATDGLLGVSYMYGDRPFIAYHSDFLTYVTDNYSEALYESNQVAAEVHGIKKIFL